jgi:ATP-dependent DNA helicase DinG
VSAVDDARAVLRRAVDALGGERRPGQDQLADAVTDAFAAGHHLVAEAPTGSGKSLAYLAPAVASQRRTVVSTATIALQDQLVGKDLPHLVQHAGVDVSFALVKGRSNYLCRAKLAAASRPDALFDVAPGPGFEEELDACRSLAATSTTGDRAEAADVSDAAWSAVSCSPMECPGATRCEYGAECFAEHAIARAADADVVVVNHALWCADLAIGGWILPEHGQVVVDEAHALADAATNAFGATLTPNGLSQLASRARNLGVPRSSTDALERAVGVLTSAIGAGSGRVRPGRDTALMDALTGARQRVRDVDGALAKLEGATADATAVALARRLVTARVETLARMIDDHDDDVVWVESERGRPFLRAAPVDVASRLGPVLAQKPTMFVSATLGAREPFAAFAGSIGLDPDAAAGPVERDGDEEQGDDAAPVRIAGTGYRALAVAPAFDWREQALLYVPKRTLPPPNDAQWAEAAGDELCRLVEAAGGRTLVLCTTNANVARFAALLRDRTGVTVLAQGEGSRAALTARFREDETSVLVGTRSFWEGVDVMGRACVLVVIDKLPFPTPADPLLAARRELVERDGGSGWRAVDLPATSLALCQGVGRLIRSRTDRGVVAVLDVRLAHDRYRYRSVLLDALPPVRRCIDRDEVARFLAEAVASVPLVNGVSEEAQRPVDAVA